VHVQWGAGPRDDFALLERLMTKKEMEEFRQLVEAYEEANGERNREQDAAGQVFYREPELVREAAKRLQKVFRRR
jgi:dsDNA-specific endonuclease/ATPase MutS2